MLLKIFKNSVLGRIKINGEIIIIKGSSIEEIFNKLNNLI